MSDEKPKEKPVKQAGKGSRPRPVKMDVYGNNYDDIFRRKEKKDMIFIKPKLEDDPKIDVPFTFKNGNGVRSVVNITPANISSAFEKRNNASTTSMTNGFFGNLKPAKVIERAFTEEEKEDEEEKKKQRKIQRTKPFKTKQCPHCATFNLIKDPDSDYFLLCKKCSWNGLDPYKD